MEMADKIPGPAASEAKNRATRALLAAIPEDERCYPGCKGWGVFMTGSRGWEIEVCDDCCRGRAITDEDVAELPEAQAALSHETGDELRCRPPGDPWTDEFEAHEAAHDHDYHPFAQGAVLVTCPTCRRTTS
jgi:hypothetical protein